MFHVGGVKVSRNKKEANSEVQTICKLLAVNPATSAAGDRSFSAVPKCCNGATALPTSSPIQSQWYLPTQYIFSQHEIQTVIA